MSEAWFDELPVIAARVRAWGSDDLADALLDGTELDWTVDGGGDIFTATAVFMVPTSRLPDVVSREQQLWDAVREAAHSSTWELSFATEVVIRPLSSDEHRPANNQATDGADHRHRVGRVLFATETEVLVFRALQKKQADLPPDRTLGIVPGCAFQALANVFWPDFLITYDGRAGLIEVDGGSHRSRYQGDHSRDNLLRDAGIRHVERIAAEDTTNPAVLDELLGRFIDRLTR